MKRKSSSRICLPRISLSCPPRGHLYRQISFYCMVQRLGLFWGVDLKAYNHLVLS